MEVRSQEEFDRALQFSNETGRFWLGGSDIHLEGVWIWDSNGDEIIRDMFWEYGQPSSINNGGSSENCLEMTLFGFNDLSCNVLRPFACETN